MAGSTVVPIYIKISEDIKKNISGKIWLPGTLLPNEFDLAKQYGVSRPTLRNALALLEKEGYILRKKCSGTMVAPSALEKKYQKLDIGFFTKLDLTCTEDYIHLFTEPLQIGNVLRRGVEHGDFIRFFPWQYHGQNPNYDLEEVIFHKGIDGFMVSAPLYLTEVIDYMRTRRVVHVALESHYDKPGVNTVMFDDNAAIEEEVARLYQLGHRRIAYFGGALKAAQFQSQARRMLEVFKRQLKKYDLPTCANWIQVCADSEWRNIQVDLNAMAAELLKNPKKRPSAVICSTTRGALAMIQAATAAGLRMPEELSMICTSIYDWESPGGMLSGHRPDMKLFADTAYRELLTWLKNPAYKPQCHLVRTEVVEGTTVAPVSN